MSGLSLTVQRDYDHSAARVWDVLGDFSNIEWAAPGIVIEKIGSGPGMTRRLHMPGMDPIDEVLEAIDPATRTFSYTIPRGLPMPITNYRAQVAVKSLDGDRSRVDWSATGDPTGDVSAEQAAEILRGAYAQMLNDLEALLARG